MKIDWKRKFSSRKFWALIAGFVTGIIVFVKSPDKSPESIGGLIMIAGSIASYIIGEGLADKKTNNFVTNYNRPHVFDGVLENTLEEDEDNGISET